VANGWLNRDILTVIRIQLASSCESRCKNRILLCGWVLFYYRAGDQSSVDESISGKVFSFKPASHVCSKSDGWSYALMYMTFDMKREDLRHKSRLVVGGHVIDSSKHNTYSSTVQDLSVRLLQLIAIRNGLSIMTGDISHAFCTAPIAEKIYTRAGPEFGAQQGCLLILKRALYGLKTASRSFHEFFADCLLRMGFTPTRADPDLWCCKSDDYDGCDYLATHVDDIIIAVKRPTEHMAQIEQEFSVRNQEDSPTYYLGNSYKRDASGNLYVSSAKYIKEVLRQFAKNYGEVPKRPVPLREKEHPELDDSELVSNADKPNTNLSLEFANGSSSLGVSTSTPQCAH